MRDALGFLTTLPVKSTRGPGRRSLACFPLVGLVVGLLWTAGAFAGDFIGGPLVAAAAVLLVDLKVTGGFHLDGVADTADGLATKHRPERIQQAIKDSRIGALGSVTATTVLIVRFALLASLAALPGWWWLLPAIPVCGRLVSLWMISRSREREGSSAAGLRDMARGLPVAAALAGTVLALAAALHLAHMPWWYAVPIVGAAVAGGETLYRSWEKHLGAHGDMLGAAAIAAEVIAAAGILVVAGHL
ncbi:adenosylcobinamide-GDP ribazoletransferase [Salininema proteolyticum]|uniref:Adenosylcobinamide-GDP ribazoletransferase n=1 Tax=Salininema proteolyticum TaxID=1607685 RepID=A0ABV8U5H1_9ACTN